MAEGQGNEGMNDMERVERVRGEEQVIEEGVGRGSGDLEEE